MEIVQQRLEQETDIDLVQTAPNVTYEILNASGETLEIHTPQKVPDPGEIEEFRQPIVRVNFMLPTEYIGPIMKLCTDRRGDVRRAPSTSRRRGRCSTYDLPLADVIYDMHDKLKSATRGYGTMDYELIGYRPADLVRLDILVKATGSTPCRSSATAATPTAAAGPSSRSSKQEIDRHMFEVPLQAAIGSRIIARETISAMRKNVTAKCYGGDITRKRKLWEKQKEGKKRMKSIGQVDIPQKAFLAVLDDSDRVTPARAPHEQPTQHPPAPTRP